MYSLVNDFQCFAVKQPLFKVTGCVLKLGQEIPGRVHLCYHDTSLWNQYWIQWVVLNAVSCQNIIIRAMLQTIQSHPRLVLLINSGDLYNHV